MSVVDGDRTTSPAAAGAADAARPLPVGSSGWRWLPVSAGIIVLDQAVKAWMVHHFAPLERVRLLSVLDIILTYNTGAAFSFLSDASGWQRWLFEGLAIVVGAGLLAWMRRLRGRSQWLLSCSLALILAGAMGKPVGILLSKDPDFRWMLGRADCPWYPSARLFRQPPSAAGWDEVVATLAAGVVCVAAVMSTD